MKVLALHATRNTSKPDATGAFIPEATLFTRMHGGVCAGFDNKLDPARCRADVESKIAACVGLDAIALFCHGHRDSMQTGHKLAHVNALADVIARASASRVVVALYACSTAKEITIGRGGFADALRDALSLRGKSGHVDAHTTAGHATRNPNVQRFDMGEDARETVGDWIVDPRSPEWRKWVRELKGDLRFQFPFMSTDEIRALVRS